MFAILQRRNLSTLIVGFLGLMKIVLDSNNIHLFTDAQINEFANGVCSVVALIALWATHLKQSVKPVTTTEQPISTQPATITLPVAPQPTPVPASPISAPETSPIAPNPPPINATQTAPQA